MRAQVFVPSPLIYRTYRCVPVLSVPDSLALASPFIFGMRVCSSSLPTSLLERPLVGAGRVSKAPNLLKFSGKNSFRERQAMSQARGYLEAHGTY